MAKKAKKTVKKTAKKKKNNVKKKVNSKVSTTKKNNNAKTVAKKETSPKKQVAPKIEAAPKVEPKVAVVEKTPETKRYLNIFLYYFVIIYFLELSYKFLVFKNVFNSNLISIVLFTAPIALIMTFITKLFSPKANKIIMWVIISILTFLFVGQYIFIGLFSVPFSFNTLSIATQALGFVDIIIKAILSRIPGIILLLLPLISLIFAQKKINYEKNNFVHNYFLILFIIITYSVSIISLTINNKGIYSNYRIYYKVDAPSEIINRFGLVTGTKIDIKRIIFGLEIEIILNNNPGKIDKDEEISYNMQDINFENLIANSKNETINNMHAYFMNETPTKKNEYTGMFEGKNLIFIIAEGFNQIAVREDVTPTLYKLTNNGFVFNNFYSPVFLSTTGGEFQATAGLIPTQETLEAWKKNQPTIPYALGHTFGNIGYNSRVYHNWTYTFYKRNLTMPTLGFNNYMGCGNGLEKRIDCKPWTPSDIDMVDTTTTDFLGKNEPFLTYYFTVSGHSNYNWGGQKIARKNKHLVDHLDLSEPAQAYLATQIELDKALELLIQRLEESGELSNTVITLVGDHYPYTLDEKTINELSTYKRDKLFEVNRSNFIIWNSEMDRIEIDKLVGQIDVLPTILNLFNINYDSRLIIGKDGLSDTEGLVIFSDRSWITKEGRYNTRTKVFTPNAGYTVDQEYIDKIEAMVANKFTMSNLIIKNNYYELVLKK